MMIILMVIATITVLIYLTFFTKLQERWIMFKCFLVLAKLTWKIKDPETKQQLREVRNESLKIIFSKTEEEEGEEEW